MITNILFTIPSLTLTGSKLPRVLRICEALDRRRFTPIVSVDHTGRLHPEGVSLLNELDTPVVTWRMSPHPQNILRSLVELIKTPSLLRKQKISIAHSFDYSRWWFEPLVVKLGGVKHWITTKANTDCAGFNWHLKLNAAEHVIAQSSQMARLIENEFPELSKKIKIIPNGVDTNIFKPRETDYELRQELNIHPPLPLIMGCIAHLAPYKDHQSLLRSLALAKNEDIELLIIGRTVNREYEQQLKTLANKLNLAKRVHFLGLRQDISLLHTVMDGIALTSRADSLSNAVLEAMSSGLPVISSDVGGMPDAVQQDVNGWLVPRGNGFVERLAVAIDDWADNPVKRKIYGRASRQIVLERFSLSKMVEGHIHLYESMLD